MSRLVNFGPGEIADRLTILTLKILYGKAAGKDVVHFSSERNALLGLLRSRELGGSWFELVLELAAVNAALWQAEDELRGLRKGGGTGTTTYETADYYKTATTCAFRIQDLNDQRAQLVGMINKATGDHLGEEKL